MRGSFQITHLPEVIFESRNEGLKIFYNFKSNIKHFMWTFYLVHSEVFKLIRIWLCSSITRSMNAILPHLLRKVLFLEYDDKTSSHKSIWYITLATTRFFDIPQFVHGIIDYSLHGICPWYYRLFPSKSSEGIKLLRHI